jgi:hypothetical protein
MLFSKTAVFVDTTSNLNFNVNYAIPQVLNFDNPIIGDTLNWSKVSAIITAQGGEKYITLGNFSDDAHTNKKIINSTVNSGTGYYLDDISVIPLDSYNLNADAGKDTTITIGDSIFIGTYTNGIDTLKWQRLTTNTTIDSTRPGFWVHPTAYTCYVLTQTVNGYTSSDTVCITVNPLPLKFINYQVALINNQIINNWQTANEINVAHFNIQRSTSGKDFYAIGKVVAKNNIYNEYNYLDMQPLNGDNYYRIQSIDKDGKASYTETKKITINDKQQTISIYPNPATATINITSQQNIQQIKLINRLGQTLQQFNNLNTKHQTINIEQFAKGVYIIQITNSNGEIKTQKIVIN